MKVADKLRVLESIGEVETYEIKDMIGNSYIISDLSVFEYRHRILGNKDFFASAEGRTENSSIHKLYKVVQRKILNECYIVNKKLLLRYKK